MSEWPYDQIWHEKIPFPGHLNTLEINADSYNAWVRNICFFADPKDLADEAFERGTQKEDVEFAETNKYTRKQARLGTNFGMISRPVKVRGKQSLGDNWTFGIRTLAYYMIGPVDWLQMGLKRRRLAVYEDDGWCFTKGAVMFTGPVHIPVLLKGSRVWMSFTPMEIYTLRDALRYAEGHVIIGGLGMGWLTRRILELPEVTRVTQVELVPEIIEFFGKPLQQMFPKKLELVEGDIYHYLANHPPADSHILDIWRGFGDAEEDEQFQDLKETHSNVWGWGDGELCDYDEPTYTDQEEDNFDNDQACWFKDDPQEWWGI